MAIGKRTSGGLKAAALTVGTYLVASGAETLATGDPFTGGLLLAGGLGSYGAHELVSRYEFAFEDDLAALIEDNDALAREVEAFIRENADTLEANADDLLTDGSGGDGA